MWCEFLTSDLLRGRIYPLLFVYKQSLSVFAQQPRIDPLNRFSLHGMKRKKSFPPNWVFVVCGVAMEESCVDSRDEEKTVERKKGEEKSWKIFGKEIQRLKITRAKRSRWNNEESSSLTHNDPKERMKEKSKENFFSLTHIAPLQQQADVGDQSQRWEIDSSSRSKQFV